jgi:hypothetical protein
LQLDGDTLTGTMLASEGSRTQIENVRYENGQLSFDVPREWNGQRFASQYAGKFDGEQLEGTVEFPRRGSSRTLTWAATRTTPEALARELETAPVAADIDLNDSNYAVWRDHILPTAGDLAWQEIPWLTTFTDGILAADAAGKPLLLWTMNGHPLGCT